MTDTGALPAGRLIAWYGDDFTGSTAVMEVLAFAGIDTVLFLDVPTAERLARFPVRAIGIAGNARAQSPGWMDRELPRVFRAIGSLGAAITHYKVCSTFDSSPIIGSIGRAIDIAMPILGGPWIPLLPAAPPVRRYQAFGNLFASIGDYGYRLDRHPVMSRHPITPMDEADVRRHLARQTTTPIALIDLVAMKSGRADELLAEEMRHGRAIVALDVIDEGTLVEAGRLIWEHRGERLFVAGSQGIEYALVAYWRSRGLLPAADQATRATRAERIVVASGSCSPLTADQIAWAERNGFARVPLDASKAVDAGLWRGETARVAAEALRLLGEGRDPLLATAAGPEDSAVAALRSAIAAAGADVHEVNRRIGEGLGRIVDQVVRVAGLRRAVIAGGDTSSEAVRSLDIFALSALAAIAPGAPLCRAHSDDRALAALELALKGGQMGAVDYFGRVRQGG